MLMSWRRLTDIILVALSDAVLFRAHIIGNTKVIFVYIALIRTHTIWNSQVTFMYMELPHTYKTSSMQAALANKELFHARINRNIKGHVCVHRVISCSDNRPYTYIQALMGI